MAKLSTHVLDTHQMVRAAARLLVCIFSRLVLDIELRLVLKRYPYQSSI